MSVKTDSQLRNYVYDDLPAGDTFRYLVLHPGSDETPLECSLHTSLMGEAPPYEAISYVWGTDILDHSLICDGKVLSITLNLSKVLRRIRLRNAPRTLWADSVCIHQKDLKEKGHQVGLMSKIYRNAIRVLMYMGEDLEGYGSPVQTLLEEVTRMIEGEFKKIRTPTWDSFPYHESVPFTNDSRWDFLPALLKQEWFIRGWVVREAALAQQGWVIWGRSEFGWAQLMLTLGWVYCRAPGIAAKIGHAQNLAMIHLDAYFDRYVATMQCLSEVSSWRRSFLLDYLAAGRALHMKDPRDRLYAFLDMSAEEERQIKVDPRYGDTALEVYQNFATHYIRETISPRILDYVVHSTQSLQAGIPTWVPSWDYQESAPLRVQPRSELTSRTGLVCEPKFVDENILKVRSIVLEPVRLATNVFNGPTTTIETIAETWEAVQMWHSATPYQGSHLLRAFLSTLTEGKRQRTPNNWAQETLNYINVLESTCDISEKNTYGELHVDTGHVQALMKTIVNSKRFILTERGYMGLSPSVTQEGDMCAIIFGCTTPCMLRRTSQQHHFKFLGPCFVLGKETYEIVDGYDYYGYILGDDNSKDWLDWDVEEQDIYLC